MADLAATDLTYTVETSRRSLGVRGRAVNRVKIVFGDGALTYPTGGVPLTKGKLGCPTYLESLQLFDDNDASGIVWKYDSENEKLRAWLQLDPADAGGANIPLTEAAGGTYVPAAQTLHVLATGY